MGLQESGPFVAEKLILYNQVIAINAQLADAFSVAPGGNLASMIVAIVKNKQLVRLPPIIAHLRPTLSMNRIQHICATKASTEEIPWYFSVSLVSIPMFEKMVCGAEGSGQYSVLEIILGYTLRSRTGL